LSIVSLLSVIVSETSPSYPVEVAAWGWLVAPPSQQFNNLLSQCNTSAKYLAMGLSGD
jgi:hypothetical protein